VRFQTAAVLTLQSGTAGEFGELALTADAQASASTTEIARKVSFSDANFAELAVAPPQSGTAHRPSHVQLPADSPFPQSTAAALTSNAEAVDIDHAFHFTEAPAAESADLAKTIRISDASFISQSAAASSDISLVPSQPGPALRPSHVHIPAVTPAPQSAAAVLTAQVSEIPNILSESLSTDDGTKQIKIQLDPPELGRVSIDFKFDGNVLQTVVVTGETPEAMRRLRLMHFELVQTLESFGYSGQDLDFSQRENQQRAFSESHDFYSETLATEPEETIFYAEPSAAMSAREMAEAEGLNLKL